MNKPHKHAALIKAWADGAQVQIKLEEGWTNCFPQPLWNEEYEYRIKPTTIKYRTYLYESYGKLVVQTCNHGDSTKPEKLRRFIKWLGDWQEVEV